MDYSLIKNICRQKEISLKDLAISVGLTPQGFHKYIRLNTMPINILERICDKLNISLLQIVANSTDVATTVHQENMDLLRENRELRIKIEQLEKNNKQTKDAYFNVNEPKLKLK